MQRGRKALRRHGCEPLQQGKREARGLAGAGLGGAEQVAAREDDGDGLRLDGSGGCVALLRDGAKQLGDQPEAFEGRTDVSLLNKLNRPARDKPSKPVQADECWLQMEIRGRELDREPGGASTG